jgi:hypothetical protein
MPKHSFFPCSYESLKSREIFLTISFSALSSDHIIIVYTYLLKLENFCCGFQSMANFVALLSPTSFHSMMTMEGCENSSTEDNSK